MVSPREQAEQRKREDHHLKPETQRERAFVFSHGSTTGGSGEENLAKFWQ